MNEKKVFLPCHFVYHHWGCKLIYRSVSYYYNPSEVKVNINEVARLASSKHPPGC